MPNKIVKKYFDVVPLFRYKEIELKERLTLIFYVVGFISGIVAFITTASLGMHYLINIPNVLIILLCVLLPFIYPKDFVKIATIMVYFVSFLYLPVTYYINGGHNGVGILYYLMMTIYISFYFEGKKLLLILGSIFAFYISTIIIGYIFPQLIIEYASDLSRLIDIVISFVSVSIVVAILANTIFVSYRIEKDNNQELLEELEKQNSKLELLSTMDQLTGVYNRRYYLKALEDEFKYFEKTNKHFYVMMIDIDDFKMVNDTYGHLYGDEILKSVAEGIKKCLRNHDIISRYGGEEFSVIISHTSEENGLIIAKRIRKAVEDLQYREKENVTISIGVVKNKEDDTELGIMKRADDYLYIAKENGKNRVEGEK